MSSSPSSHTGVIVTQDSLLKKKNDRTLAAQGTKCGAIVTHPGLSLFPR